MRRRSRRQVLTQPGTTTSTIAAAGRQGPGNGFDGPQRHHARGRHDRGVIRATHEQPLGGKRSTIVLERRPPHVEGHAAPVLDVLDPQPVQAWQQRGLDVCEIAACDVSIRNQLIVQPESDLVIGHDEHANRPADGQEPEPFPANGHLPVRQVGICADEVDVERGRLSLEQGWPGEIRVWKDGLREPDEGPGSVRDHVRRRSHERGTRDECRHQGGPPPQAGQRHGSRGVLPSRSNHQPDAPTSRTPAPRATMAGTARM